MAIRSRIQHLKSRDDPGGRGFVRFAAPIIRRCAFAGLMLGTLSACAMPTLLDERGGTAAQHASVRRTAQPGPDPNAQAANPALASATTPAATGSQAPPAPAVSDPTITEAQAQTALEPGPPEPLEAGSKLGSEPGSEPGRATPAPHAPAADIWARIRRGFAMPELKTPLVARHKSVYLANPDQLYRMLERGGPYLFYIVEELEKRGMPSELALLPFVESAMNPVALSPAQAAGLWQFIPATGRRYELTQNWWVDNRRDVAQSTRAALEYLNTLYEMNNQDWFLALASYNWGEHAVSRAVHSNRSRRRPTDYLSLSMPNETRHYVPKLIALKEIVLQAHTLGLSLPPVPDEPYFAMIEKTRPIDLRLAAEFAGMTVEEFQTLNPAHNRPVISARRNQVIKLPEDRLETFTRAMAEHLKAGKPLATWQPYTLLPGESIAEVAARATLRPAEVLQANGIRPGAVILPGSRLLVPAPTGADELLLENFDGSVIYEEVRRPTRHHVVRAGESLPAIARRYGLSVQQLQKLNSRAGDLKPGMRLLVETASVQIVRTTQTGARQTSSRAEQTRAAQAAQAARNEAARLASGRPSTVAAGFSRP